MKIIAYAICYNEEAMLPFYLRHYLSFCDHVVVYDNCSTDRSVEICKGFANVTVITYNTSNVIRDDVYLQIKNNCWKSMIGNSMADWVIVGDIDEFVYHPDIRGELERTWATIITPDLFNMFSPFFPVTKGQIYEQVTNGISGGGKANLFRPADIREINYDPGCHVAHPEGNILWDTESGIKTLHNKFMGLEHTLARKRLSESRLSELNKAMGWGVHYSVPEEQAVREFYEGLDNSRRVI